MPGDNQGNGAGVRDAIESGLMLIVRAKDTATITIPRFYAHAQIINITKQIHGARVKKYTNQGNLLNESFRKLAILH